MLRILLSMVGLAAVSGGLAVAEDAVLNKDAEFLNALERADECVLKVRVKGLTPDAAPQVVKKANVYGMAFVLARTCTGKEGAGKVSVEVAIKGGTARTFYSNGLGEDFFILRHLPKPVPFEDWLKKAVPVSADVVVIPARDNSHPEALTKLHTEIKEYRPERDLSPALAGTLALAKGEYDKRRPELIGRMSSSYLYYAEAKDRVWFASEDGERVTFSTFCADKMMAGKFFVQFDRDAKSKALKFTRIVACEWFKGE